MPSTDKIRVAAEHTLLAGFIPDIPILTHLNVLYDLVFETEVVVVAEVQVEPLKEVILLIELDVLINICMVATVSRYVSTTDAVALFLPPEGVPQLLEDGDPPRDPRPGGAGRTHGGLPRAAHDGRGTMECWQCDAGFLLFQITRMLVPLHNGQHWTDHFVSLQPTFSGRNREEKIHKLCSCGGFITFHFSHNHSREDLSLLGRDNCCR